MSVPNEQPDAIAARCAPGIPRKLKMLVAAHLVLGVLPVLSGLVPLEVRFLPLLWALSSLTLGQVMLLALWAGMGKSRAVVRLAGTMSGIAYAVAWQTLAMIFHLYALEQSAVEYLRDYVGLFGAYCGMALMLTAVFLVMRRWWCDLRCSDEWEASPRGRFQYSLLHLLVIASLVCLILSLAQNARPEDGALATQWHMLAVNALGFVVLVVNVFCAARAALGMGAAARPIFLSLITAALLGVALAIGMGHDRLGWAVFVGSALVFVLPAAIVIASLIVVRSCGYRLISKSDVPSATRSSPSGA